MNILQTTMKLKNKYWDNNKNPEMVRFFPDYLKNKEMHKCAVKKLPFLIRHVPDGYKT